MGCWSRIVRTASLSVFLFCFERCGRGGDAGDRIDWARSHYLWGDKGDLRHSVTLRAACDSGVNDTHKSPFNFVANIAEKAVPAVVGISCYHRGILDHFGPYFSNYESKSSGSGVLVSSDGMILSNAHTVVGCDRVSVEFSDGRNFSAVVVAVDNDVDLSLLRIQGHKNESFKFLELADSDNTCLGEWVVAIGSPFSLKNSVSVGIVSALGRQDIGPHRRHGTKYIQTDAAINVGNSGGPLVDLSGKVIGINTMTVFPAQGISFAVPSNVAKGFLGRAARTSTTSASPPPRTHHDVSGSSSSNQPPSLGVSAQPLGEAQLSQFRRSYPQYFTEVTYGLNILDVKQGSLAQRAGVRPGDIIIGVSGKKLQSIDDFMAVISKRLPCHLELFRESTLITLPLNINDTPLSP